MKSGNRDLFPVIAVLGAAALLRFVFVPAPGYERDIYWFATWMRTALEHGVPNVSAYVWCDYPPGYLYLLKAVGFVWVTLTNSWLPADKTVAMNFLVKLVPNAADITGAYVLFHMAKTRLDRRAAFAVMAAYAFNPVMVFNGAVWGQVDSLTSLLVLLSVWSLYKGRIGISLGIAAAAILVKFQAVVIVPFLAAGAFALQGRRGLMAAFRGMAVSAVVILLPYYWYNRVDQVIAIAFDAVGRYPYISMNAHNIWWLVGGASAPSIPDAVRVGNAVLSYHDIGLIIFGVVTCLIMIRLWRDLRRKDKDGVAVALFQAITLELVAFYLFPTQMHERYIVPAVMTLAALCIWKPKMWWLYAVMSLSIFVSLASTLNSAYPGGMGGFGSIFPPGRQEAFIVSLLLILVFIILLFWSKDRPYTVFAASAAVIVAGSLLLYTSSAVAKPQLLSDWEPVAKSQDWGKLHRNRTVDDRRLSIAGYVFRRGLGTHANSRIKYHLNRGFSRFDTAFGVDDEAARSQMVRFRILADSSVIYDSGVINAGGWPRHVNVDVAGAEYLTLEVLDGGDGISFDHADWIEPTLYR